MTAIPPQERGFWEVELHDALRGKGRDLLMVQRAVAEFGFSFPLGLISRHRFAHGRHFGTWRVRRQYVSASRVMLAAPIVPFVLLQRIAGRVMRGASKRLSFTLASPVVLWLAICWSCGEAVGAVEFPLSDRHATRSGRAVRIGIDATCWANERGYGRFTRKIVTAMAALAPEDEFLCFLDRKSADVFHLNGPNVRKAVINLVESPVVATSASGRRRIRAF